MSTPEFNAVTLIINGLAYGGWKSVRIEAGIERQARSFALQVTDSWPGLGQVRRVRPGQACELRIGKDPVLTGYIDSVPVSYDGGSISVSIKGRSKTADLVDCCPQTPPTQWRRMKLEAIAAELAKPYGVEVVAETSTGQPIADFSLQLGETVFEGIDRMLRQRQVLSTDNERGQLVLIQVGTQRAQTAIELGQNVISGSCEFDYANVFTHYICKAQRPIADGEAPAAGAEQQAQVDDTPSGPASAGDMAPLASVPGAQLLGRRRMLILKSSGQADEGQCQDRVEYERAHRQAKAIETSYTLTGWRQQDGSLWQPNLMVRVRDAEFGFDQDMLISAITYVLDEQGMRTELKVGPLAGFISQPTAAQKAGGA